MALPQYSKHSAPHPVWQELRAEAANLAVAQPEMALTLNRVILSHETLCGALASRLATKLGDSDYPAAALEPLLHAVLDEDIEIATKVTRDFQAYRLRDPACTGLVQVFLFFKGFAALQAYRAAHIFWEQERTLLAYYIQSRCSELLQVDIHPAARLGAGVFIDHATGVVLGETCVIGDDVTIMHDVTLGGNGKERGDRHPKIGKGVLLSVGAKVLGNISVGNCARIAAGSVVLQDVPAGVTVAGIPARPVGDTPGDPAECLEHNFNL